MFLNQFRNRIIVKNTLILIVGVGIAQIIAIVFQLITRRLYSPDDFGAYAVYYSIVSILASIVPLQYNKAIVLPNEKDKSTNLLFGTIFIISIFSVCIFFTVVFIPSIWTELIEFPEKYFKWLYFMPITVFLFASYDAINYWLIKNKAFKASSVNKIIRRTGEGITQVGVGYTKNSIGILLGDIIGNFLNLIAGIVQSIRFGLKIKNVNISNIKRELNRYIDFPKYYAIPNLFNSVSLVLPVLIVNKLYSDSIVGYFDLSRMVLAAPLALITISLSQVLLQNISEKRNNHKPIKKDILKTAGYLSIMVFIGIIIIELFANEIFQLFGKQYTISGVYTRILVFSYGIKFIVSPLASVFPALEKIKIGALWQIFYFCFLSVLFLFKNIDILVFLKILVGIELICYIIYFIFIYFVVNQYDKSLKD
ncbi:MAG: hypothetical protein A2X13_01655 [Bacteroidetes bacterium GWC2_33_15]|nr:MAG: hypothetical protein A2X10_07970 [Bacteroidetes bacterium GWA2_33_15]OFX52187.1 MAG: hypothetical protein A2X13_01655 [Bacteroidetes bacterium GWC2_33_15]OFX64341.1 MAG: hypothetical protein A2X15_12475 [Bacteroidetes bacterium GWB2_32_14]OFX67746.1 MAG: hypothetical protein A2X14_06300 [Bacteroidetes bacterium GWD2_33_33]HAN19357.1 hypothetical protein [Bacteroidales bacterium]